MEEGYRRGSAPCNRYCSCLGVGLCCDWFIERGREGRNDYTVKILKFGTPQTIAIIVLKIEKFDVTLH